MAQKKDQGETGHTYIQWLLAKIGLKIGCSSWVAVGDHEKMWNEEKLEHLSLSSLPLLVDSAFQRMIEHIDILWLRKSEVIAAYEMALTADDVAKSLLRLSDLAVLFPKRNVQLCLVAPQDSLEYVQLELSRPIFHHSDMQKRTTVLIQENFLRHAEHILRWANSPSVIHDLTLHLSTLNSENVIERAK